MAKRENAKSQKVQGVRPNQLHRRTLIKLGLTGIAAPVFNTEPRGSSLEKVETEPLEQMSNLAPARREFFAASPMETVRIGFVGVGGMGSAHCQNLLRIDGAEIRSVCDIIPNKVARIQDRALQAGQRKPAGYSRGEFDFVRMCETEDLDLVFTATPWRWHVPVCLAAMRNDKHAATEVPAAVTLEECWQLVENAEKHQKHCVMMENVCYGRPEMMHAECGYLHDLRAIKFSSEGEGLWRREHSILRNGNLYPTHGLGPIANYMNINRGDQFEYLVSMSSNSRGLQIYAQDNFPPGSSQRSEHYALGDVNISLIQTINGRPISLSHNTNLPRPYSRIHMIQGTRGVFQGYPDRVHIEGRSPEHQWESVEKYYKEFEHPLWSELGGKASSAGHGGMDYLEDYRLIKCLREGLPTDMNVYDASVLSAVSEVSERSVSSGSQPVDFPDFTRGRWRSYSPLGIVTG